MPFSAYCTGPGYERMWTSRNPEEKGAIHSCSEHLVMSKIECLCAWDMEKIKSWSHVSRSSVEQKYSTLHRKVEVARLPGEHRRGVQPDRGLREGFWMRESELRRCWAVACRTRSHHSPTLCKLAVAPQAPRMESASFLWCPGPREEAGSAVSLLSAPRAGSPPALKEACPRPPEPGAPLHCRVSVCSPCDTWHSALARPILSSSSTTGEAT